MALFRFAEDVARFLATIDTFRGEKRELAGEAVLVRESGQTFPALLARSSPGAVRDCARMAEVLDVRESRPAHWRAVLSAEEGRGSVGGEVGDAPRLLACCRPAR
jgi:hypothetical protein